MKEMLERYMMKLDELMGMVDEYERYICKIAMQCQGGGHTDENKRICIP